MQVRKTKNFIKNFTKRVLPNKALEIKFHERLTLFILDRSNPVLKDHKLSGRSEGLSAFSITGDVRVIYFLESEQSAVFVDIGSHNQVYN